MDSQLSTGFFDVVRDLHDTQLALLCLICWLSDVSVNHLRSTYRQSRSLPSNVNTIEIVLYLYLFLLQTEIACFLVKLAIVIFVFFAAQIDQRELTFAGCGVWGAGCGVRGQQNGKKNK